MSLFIGVKAARELATKASNAHDSKSDVVRASMLLQASNVLNDACVEIEHLSAQLESITEGSRFSCDCGQHTSINYEGLSWFPAGHGEDMGECAARGASK